MRVIHGPLPSFGWRPLSCGDEQPCHRLAGGHLRCVERLGQCPGPLRGAPRGRGFQPARRGQVGSALRQGCAQTVGQQLGFPVGVIGNEFDPWLARVVRAPGQEVGVEVAVDHDVATPFEPCSALQEEVCAGVPQLAPLGEF